MNFIAGFFQRVRVQRRKRQLEADMTEEIRLHLEQRTEEHRRSGLSPEEARFAALRQFGGVDQVKEVCRDQRSWAWLEQMAQHVRVSIRLFAKTPGFTLTALATLALCLGANLTIFAVVDSILIRPLPFPDSGRLVTLYYVYPKLPSATSGASLTNYYERRGKIPALASLAEVTFGTTVAGEPGATTIEGLGRITSEFFATLGVKPFLGRAFTDAEMTYQSDHEAMISFEYWQSRYAGDPAVLGRSIRIDGIARTIVGVLPRDFRFLASAPPIYMPLSSEEGERNIGARHSVGKILFGRLAEGATRAEAQAQIDALDAVLAPLFPDAKVVADAGCRTVVASLHDDAVTAVRPVLLLLQAAAIFLLLIGGINLTNLLLIRASGRAREVGIRQALGASRGHVIRETLTETILLTVLGAFLGLGVGAGGIRLLAALGAKQLPLGTPIALDGRVAMVALLVAVVAGVAFGLPIVWLNLRHRLAVALQSESRGSTAARATQHLRHGFIVAQIALAFILLTGAGLLGLSLKRAMAVSPGFTAEQVVAGQFNLTWFGYHDASTFGGFFDRLLERSRSLPGVSAFGVVSNVPAGGPRDGDAVTVPGYRPKPGESVSVHDVYAVAGDYFATMEIPLLAGRRLRAGDSEGPLVCVVDEAFARHYWPNGDAVGKSLYRGTQIDKDDRPFTIVGVVGSVKQGGLGEGLARGAVYFPYSRIFFRNFYLVARTSLAAESIGPMLRGLLRGVDPDMPLTDLRPMDARIDDSLATRRSPALLAAVFALTALLLAIIGLYGVMAYSVSQRSSEFGIRMALGAQRRDVLRLVFGEGLRLTLIGLSIGVFAALLLTDTMSSQLFEVQARDPRAFVGIGLLLAGVASIACLLPAFRATRIDPVVALRAE
ncbi:MAG TPA: ABC transporter permease [Candidatus Didemnitutus sp.]|nr:ABC transporter permease [Candidatus Didemnitutus sp.]